MIEFDMPEEAENKSKLKEGGKIMTLKELGGNEKFLVIKFDDLRHINSIFKIEMLKNDLKDIREGRKAEGKNPCPEYIVVNMDEPYIHEIIEILKKNGDWG